MHVITVKNGAHVFVSNEDTNRINRDGLLALSCILTLIDIIVIWHECVYIAVKRLG